MENNKRNFEDMEIPVEAGGRKGKVYKNTNPPKGTVREKWRHMKKWKKAVIIAVAVIILLAVIALVTVWGIYNSGFKKNLNEDNLGLNDVHANSGIFNVVVFGLDSRDKEAFTGRSDSIIIVSIDRKNKTVKLTSILRDSYVAIEGHKNQKITHAYAFGGAELAINTVNRNFSLDISDYATINFFKMAEAIDVLGGIDIEITESEMNQINSEATGGTQKGAALVDHYGKVHLDGDQATIFCRLRKQDSDEARSNRQKMVVEALLAQARKISPSKYPEVVKSIMALCETSLSFSEVMSFAPMINEDITIESITVPGEPENAFGGIYDGAWVWKYDLEQATRRIHMFIYGEEPDFSLTTTTTTTAKASKDNSGKGQTSPSNEKKNNTATTSSNVIVITGKSEEETSPAETTTAAEAVTSEQTKPQTSAQEPPSEAQTSPESEKAESNQENTTSSGSGSESVTEPATSTDEAA